MENLNSVLKAIGENNNGNVKFPVMETEIFLNTSIEELELDNRSYNTLKRANCNIVREVLLNLNTLSHIKGCGTKTMSRIMYQICAYYYSQLTEKGKQNYLDKLVKINCE